MGDFWQWLKTGCEIFVAVRVKNHGQAGDKEERTIEVSAYISLTFLNPRRHNSNLQ